MCKELPAMSLSRFQIGSDNYKYIYTDTDMEVNDTPIYKCTRGTEKSPTGFVLWLHRSQTGQWEAREAPIHTEQPVQEGKNVFRTQDDHIDDISVPGAVSWQWWDEDKNHWVDFNFDFWTKRV